MKKTMQYALLLFCLQENIMITAPSFFTEIPEITEDQPTRNTAEEARNRRAAEKKMSDQQHKNMPTQHQEVQPKETDTDTKTTTHDVQVNTGTQSLASNLTSRWNTFKRRMYSLIHEKSYVKEVMTQALNGDLNAMAEKEKFAKDRNVWNKQPHINNLSFKDKQDVVETLQNEANKVYTQKMADLKHQKLLASGNNDEKNRIQHLIDAEKEAFKDTVQILVDSLNPMLHQDKQKATSQLKKPNEMITVRFDPQTNVVRLGLYRTFTTLDSVLNNVIPRISAENLTPEQEALKQRFHNNNDNDNTLNDNINQKYRSLTPSQREVFIDNLKKLATSTLSTSTADILDAAYDDAQKVSTSWLSKITTTNNSTASNPTFTASKDIKADATRALAYIQDVQKRFTQGRIDSLDAITQISSAFASTDFKGLRETKVLPQMLALIQTKENQEYQQKMNALTLKTATSTADFKLIMLQRQEFMDAFKTRCTKIQAAFEEIYRQSLNNSGNNLQQITLTFDKKEGTAQFTIEPITTTTPKSLLEKPKKFPDNLNSAVKAELLSNQDLLNTFMETYENLLTHESKIPFIDMINSNATSQHPYPLTKTLIDTTMYIATMPEGLAKALDPQFKHLLMNNPIIAHKLYENYQTQL